ncbi:MAG: thioredoxin domain-containing protein [Planctomycetes bacterium]|nr:thioredoxin domain-containing protein [Planctomycetota bacterium]
MSQPGSNSIEWLPWAESSFELARKQHRPVLLTIVASWCRYCRELDETTFADPKIVERIRDAYVPVRVDKDRRPDINARYNCGGWPTIAFLTPGGDLIAGETFLTSAELMPILDRVAPFFREHGDEIRSRVEELEEIRIRAQERRELGSLSASILDAVGTSVLESFDSVHGGFGTGSKFPHAEAIDFALATYVRHGDERMRQVVVRTLDAMARGEIRDTVEGGFFRYAQARDWRAPHTEKMLDSNASRLRFYLEAFQVLGTPSYREVAEGILGWMDARLRDSESGAYFGSQDADPEYYGLPIERRRARNSPRVDRTIYADWNAIAASALFVASTTMERPVLREQGAQVLKFIVDEMVDDKKGVYHYWDGTFHLPGLLSDQAYVLRALTDALAYTGDPRWLEQAVRLAAILRARHLSSSGGFYDLPHDASDLKNPVRRNRSILENSVVAEGFIRLGILLRDDSYLRTAREALQSFTQDYRQYGYYVAGYARAVDLLLHEPIHVTVVGSWGSEVEERLRIAALGRYMPNRVVDAIDPKREPARLQRAGLPSREVPTAFVSVGRASFAEVTDPAELPAALEAAERDRMG